jgi:hypothetical protein
MPLLWNLIWIFASNVDDHRINEAYYSFVKFLTKALLYAFKELPHVALIMIDAEELWIPLDFLLVLSRETLFCPYA